MSFPPFDITSSEFLLCTANIKINSTSLIIAVSLIDTYSKKIKLAQFVDSSFFSSLESLLKQIIPEHEDIKYFFLANIPNSSYKDKIDYISKQLNCIDATHFEVNSKKFNEKIFNVWTNLKLILTCKEEEKYNVIFNKEEFLLPLETLYYTNEIVQIAQCENYQNCFSLEKLNLNEYMAFDISCVKCLNLFDNFEERKHFLQSSVLNKLSKNNSFINNNSNNISVFSILNQCCTKFGSRTLRTWLMQPLQNKTEIQKRLDIVELFTLNNSFNREIRGNFMIKLDDMQTINMKLGRYISLKDKDKNNTNSGIKLVDCAKLQRCIGVCKGLYAYIQNYEGEYKELFFDKYVNPLNNILKLLGKLEELISMTVVYDNNTREYVIRSTIDNDLNDMKKQIDERFAKIEKIKNEVEEEINQNSRKFKKVKLDEYVNAGYVLELLKSDGDDFFKHHREYKLISTNKRTIIMSSHSLSELSSEIKSLKSSFKETESIYIKKVLNVISTYHPVIENLIIILSSLDILSSFASMVSNSKYQYTKPIILPSKSRLSLRDSRHIILENLPKAKGEVISNSCELDSQSNTVHLLTGINMGGKSTYLKQVGICVILAHIGCFVPASYAEIPIIDQIFTRVGAGDIMLKGISTYMNEMIEVCSLIKSASDKSLLLIDELGRGTSTDDGVGISYAILYYISKEIGAYCLFATHFFELTEMEQALANVKNYYMSYSVQNGEVIMEYKVLKGKSDSSFGVGMLRALNFDNDTCETLERFLKEENNMELEYK